MDIKFKKSNEFNFNLNHKNLEDKLAYFISERKKISNAFDGKEKAVEKSLKLPKTPVNIPSPDSIEKEILKLQDKARELDYIESSVFSEGKDLRLVNEQKSKLFSEYSKLKNSVLLNNNSPKDIYTEISEENILNNMTDFDRPHDKTNFNELETTLNLKTKLRELEKKCALQQLKHEEILLEIESISKGNKNAPELFLYSLGQQRSGSPKVSKVKNEIPKERLLPIGSGFVGSENRREDQKEPFFGLEGGQYVGGMEPMYNLIRLRNQATLPETLNTFDHPRRKRLVMVKASYNPEKDSIKLDTENELSIKFGDYVLVFGVPDKEGFYYGETMDKRRGLIPSAYIDEIKCFSNKQLARIAENSNLANLFGFVDDFNPEEENVTEYEIDYAYKLLNDDVFSIGEDSNDDDLNDYIPGPKNLTLEKQLANSAMISWKHPNIVKEINAFHVYLDGQFRVSVKISEKPRALIENVESDRPHRVSVRSVTNRGQSKDAQCTIEIGRGATPTPGRLKATKITCNSAKLSWLPGNSNYPHIVFLNDVEIKRCEQGIYKFVLTELPPDTVQRICIQAQVMKEIHPLGIARRAPKCSINEKSKFAVDKSAFAAFIEFRTLHIGLPDPPSRVQVEPGPQDGFLLVTWRAVKINDIYSRDEMPTEMELPVTGYSIAINGRLLKSVEDHKIDHCLIDFDNLGVLLQSLAAERTLDVDENLDNAEEWKYLLTVHSIVKKNKNVNDDSKLGPSSKPVLLDNEILLKSAGSHELALEKLGPDICQLLNINEQEAERLNIPIMIPTKEESEDKEVDGEIEEKSSLTIAAGSAVRQENLSKQEDAVNTAENLLNLRKRSEKSLTRLSRKHLDQQHNERRNRKNWAQSRSISEGHYHEMSKYLSESSSSLSIIDQPTMSHQHRTYNNWRDNFDEPIMVDGRFPRALVDGDRRKRATHNHPHQNINALPSTAYRSHSASRNNRHLSMKKPTYPEKINYPLTSVDGNWPDIRNPIIHHLADGAIQNGIYNNKETNDDANLDEEQEQAEEEPVEEEQVEEEPVEEDVIPSPEKVAQVLNEKFDEFANSMKDIFSIKKDEPKDEDETVKEGEDDNANEKEKSFFELMQEKMNEAAEKIKESAENLGKKAEEDKEEEPPGDFNNTEKKEVKKEKSFFELMQEKMDEAAAKIRESAEQTRKDLEKATSEMQEKLTPKQL